MRAVPRTQIAAAGLLACVLVFSPSSQGRPYAGVSGLAASADSATTASTNPAGIARFSEPAYRAELVVVQSESEWAGRLWYCG